MQQPDERTGVPARAALAAQVTRDDPLVAGGARGGRPDRSLRTPRRRQRGERRERARAVSFRDPHRGRAGQMIAERYARDTELSRCVF